MIAVVVFALHGIAAVYAFVTRKKQGGLTEGILAVAFLGIIFSVGWTILTLITNLIFPPEGFATWFNRDAITLTLLTIAESLFYFFFLRSERENNKENQEKRGAAT